VSSAGLDGRIALHERLHMGIEGVLNIRSGIIKLGTESSCSVLWKLILFRFLHCRIYSLRLQQLELHQRDVLSSF
jgi:hypothetical protein